MELFLDDITSASLHWHTTLLRFHKYGKELEESSQMLIVMMND